LETVRGDFSTKYVRSGQAELDGMWAEKLKKRITTSTRQISHFSLKADDRQ